MDVALAILKSLGALFIILAGCELFTNGIEWFGSRLSLSRAAVGSVLAAVGTALPETVVPLVAILLIGGKAAHEIGMGAILGAPFMLGTLAFTITGVAVMAFAGRRDRGREMRIHAGILSQDLGYFLVVYSLAVAVSFVLGALQPLSRTMPHLQSVVRIGVGVGLLGAYAFYVYRHFQRRDEEEEEELRALYFHYTALDNPHMRAIVVQVFVSLVAILTGAHIFVENLKHISEALNVSPLLLSMVVTPIATELPEKFNSVIWVRQGKDTLAMGNISGAMVFQSCIPVAVGITMTAWVLDLTSLVCALAALTAAAVVYVSLKLTGALNPKVLLVGLPLYFVFLAVAFWPK